MQFLMITYTSEEGASLYESLSEEQQRAGIEEHQSWFEANGEALRGGFELAWPRRVGRIRSDQQLAMLDGPFAESKEAIGGVIVLEAESLEEAAEMAKTWPSLRLYSGAMVDVIPTSSR
jgi:hypothetical protein